MGGGTPLLEANRVGCDVTGYDINPMAYWIVKQEIEHLNLDTYIRAAEKLRKFLEKEIGSLYRTKCIKCGSKDAHAKYFLWVKVQRCQKCGQDIDLFQGNLISKNIRHPQNVLFCAACGDLNEVEDRRHPGKCGTCGEPLIITGSARRNRCICTNCGEINIYPDPDNGPPRHRMFALEYHCPFCKPSHKGRFFKKPDADDLARFQKADAIASRLRTRFVPDDEIPSGDETDRLHRWGYRRYREMFNARQIVGLELSCRFIEKEPDERVRNALATNLSDLLRYQNMLCRYDTMALKSLDIFSVHGFPVGLIQCESNFLGIPNVQKRANIGSGGWSNIIDKFVKAKTYCDEPFEIRHHGKKKVKVPIPGEWIGDTKNGNRSGERRSVDLFCANAATADLSPDSLDAVFTDPPYFGNVQYAELMDFCYVWLRRLTGETIREFRVESTRNINELTGNENMGRGLEHFTKGLSSVFQRMANALKRGAPLAFTYHHNRLDAYYPVAVAILDARLTCSASLPCPAEMGASIHISGTASSIVDTIFVCRSTGQVPHRWIVDTTEGVANLVREDLEKLRAGKVRPTQGDIRCIIFGHLIRLAVWFLRKDWERSWTTNKQIDAVARWIDEFGGLASVQDRLEDEWSWAPRKQKFMVRESEATYGEYDAEISF